MVICGRHIKGKEVSKVWFNYRENTKLKTQMKQVGRGRHQKRIQEENPSHGDGECREREGGPGKGQHRPRPSLLQRLPSPSSPGWGTAKGRARPAFHPSWASPSNL